jgi:hypothetical protein
MRWCALASLCENERIVAESLGHEDESRVLAWRARYARHQARAILALSRAEEDAREARKLAWLASEVRGIGARLGTEFTPQLDSIARALEWVGEVAQSRQAVEGVEFEGAHRG